MHLDIYVDLPHLLAMHALLKPIKPVNNTNICYNFFTVDSDNGVPEAIITETVVTTQPPLNTVTMANADKSTGDPDSVAPQ